MAIYRAKESFAYPGGDGYTRVIQIGELFDSADSVLKGRGQYFESVEVAAARQAGVEEATAEPGKLRSISTPKPQAKPAEVEPVEEEPVTPKPVYGATHPPLVKRGPGRPRKPEEK